MKRARIASLALAALISVSAWPALAAAGEAAAQGQKAGAPALAPLLPVKPRAYFLYIHDGRDPLVVDNYREEKGEIVFEKYGGRIRIPKDEILRIVPDQPEPPRGPGLPRLPQSSTDASPTTLYLSLKGGGNLKVSRLVQEKDRLRVTLNEGSFTIPSSEVVGILSVPKGGEGAPEAWLEVNREGGAAPTPPPPSETVTRSGPPPAEPAPPSSVSTIRSSNQPHVLRTTSGQTIRVERFWIEEGEVKFPRFGGIVGVPLGSVRKLVPEKPASGQERILVHLVRLLGPTLLEVRIKGEVRRVRLLGVEAFDGVAESRDPWRQLRQGSVLQLEYDREVEEKDRTLLAYVFLPNGRMLNAELIRLGLARPVLDPRALKYLDLFYELEGQPRPDLKK